MQTAFDRIKLTALYPPFARKLGMLVGACLSRGFLYVATSGLRSIAEQERLYAIGRTTDRDGKPITLSDPAYGKTVTNARGNTGPHPFGVGCDLVRDADANLADGLQPDYLDEHYVVLAEEAVKLQLTAGYYWPITQTRSFKDSGHVELPVHAHGLRWADLEIAYHQGGYPAVFAALDQKGPWQT